MVSECLPPLLSYFEDVFLCTIELLHVTSEHFSAQRLYVVAQLHTKNDFKIICLSFLPAMWSARVLKTYLYTRSSHTRCCSCCRRSSLYHAERASRLSLSLCLSRLQHSSLSSADSDALWCNVSSDVCLLRPDLVSGDRGHLYDSIEDSTD